ncbi:DUF5681 domain-containing protein [Methyloligella solikamskensis]|uniref:DUF5681 domain-containing protein n=1 Tax=Methyloligella solikamskensis TaxID=1177756 RepID=A0ABW3JBF2_9HYPH
MSNDQPTGDYEVGYCKPPAHTQFKPGQSGNPKGRPKREVSLLDALSNACGRPVKMREGGQEIIVSSLEAMITRQVTEAIQGDAAALRLLLPVIERWLQPTQSGAETLHKEVHVDRLREKINKITERQMPSDSISKRGGDPN